MNTQSSARQPHILMCPPQHYAIHYEINPWMSRQRQADPASALQQWEALQQILEQCGAKISLLQPQAGLPDLVFTANAALIYQRTAHLARFRHPQRQGEEVLDAQWFEQHAYEVQQLPPQLYFEGAGDALFCGETLFAGYRIRSDAAAHQHLARVIGCRVIPLELIDAYYYHLDTCFCPVAQQQAIYAPAAFDHYGRQVLENEIPELIEVDPDEAKQFACNAVVVGQKVVTNTGCPQLHRQLRSRGFEPIETPLHEFVKSGGSAKCLTLRLDGEDAAQWAQT